MSYRDFGWRKHRRNNNATLHLQSSYEICKLFQNGYFDIVCVIYIDTTFFQHSNIKFLLVDSCIDHTNVLSNWHLILEVLLNTSDKKISLDLKIILSELFLESVQISLTGKPSKLRASYIGKWFNMQATNNNLSVQIMQSNIKYRLYFQRDRCILPIMD